MIRNLLVVDPSQRLTAKEVLQVRGRREFTCTHDSGDFRVG